MTNARIESNVQNLNAIQKEKKKENPRDSLKDNAKRIAKILSDISSEQLVKIILQSVEDYNRLWRRVIFSRKPLIEMKLRELGYESIAADKFANLKSPIEIFTSVTEDNGKENSSFHTYFMQAILACDADIDVSVKLTGIECDHLKELVLVAYEKRMQNEKEINEQKAQLALAKSQRLKEEEALLKTQLEKMKCENELSELSAKKSGESAELSELEREKSEREVQLRELQEKILKYEQDEKEKQIQLEKTQQNFEEMKAAFEDVSKKYEASHVDFKITDLNADQLQECNLSARQAFQQNVAVIKGKIKLTNELAELNANGARNKGIKKEIAQTSHDPDIKKLREERETEMSSLIAKRDIEPKQLEDLKKKISLSLRFGPVKTNQGDDPEIVAIREKRKADVNALVEERKKEMGEEKLKKIKHELSLCLQLGQNKAAQAEIEGDKREILLQTDGYYATVHNAEPIAVQENYGFQQNTSRQLEKKPTSKSFRDASNKLSLLFNQRRIPQDAVTVENSNAPKIDSPVLHS